MIMQCNSEKNNWSIDLTEVTRNMYDSCVKLFF